MMAQIGSVVVGIDVAKDKVDACIRSLSQRQTFLSDAQGRRKLIAWLRKHQIGKAGLGKVSSAGLIAAMPELGQVSNKIAAALLGVAPYDDDSGQRRGNVTSRADAARSAISSTWPVLGPPPGITP